MKKNCNKVISILTIISYILTIGISLFILNLSYKQNNEKCKVNYNRLCTEIQTIYAVHNANPENADLNPLENFNPNYENLYSLKLFKDNSYIYENPVEEVKPVTPFVTVLNKCVYLSNGETVDVLACFYVLPPNFLINTIKIDFFIVLIITLLLFFYIILFSDMEFEADKKSKLENKKLLKEAEIYKRIKNYKSQISLENEDTNNISKKTEKKLLARFKELNPEFEEITENNSEDFETYSSENPVSEEIEKEVFHRFMELNPEFEEIKEESTNEEVNAHKNPVIAESINSFWQNTSKENNEIVEEEKQEVVDAENINDFWKNNSPETQLEEEPKTDLDAENINEFWQNNSKEETVVEEHEVVVEKKETAEDINSFWQNNSANNATLKEGKELDNLTDKDFEINYEEFEANQNDQVSESTFENEEKPLSKKEAKLRLKESKKLEKQIKKEKKLQAKEEKRNKKSIIDEISKPEETVENNYTVESSLKNLPRYSLSTGFTCKEQFPLRLDEQLLDSSKNQDELSLFSFKLVPIDFTKGTGINICNLLIELYFDKDHLFEGENNEFYAIKNISIDNAIKYANKIKNTIIDLLNKDGQGEVFVGISSRSGRLISGNRLINEAKQALNHAVNENTSSIIAFKIDDEKYRDYLNKMTK